MPHFPEIIGTVKKFSYTMTPYDFYSGSKKSKKKGKAEEIIGQMDQVSVVATTYDICNAIKFKVYL